MAASTTEADTGAVGVGAVPPNDEFALGAPITAARCGTGAARSGIGGRAGGARSGGGSLKLAGMAGGAVSGAAGGRGAASAGPTGEPITGAPSIGGGRSGIRFELTGVEVSAGGGSGSSGKSEDGGSGPTGASGPGWATATAGTATPLATHISAATHAARGMSGLPPRCSRHPAGYPLQSSTVWSAVEYVQRDILR